MKKILVATILFALTASIASAKEELVVLSCSGEESGMDLFSMRSYEKKFNNDVVKLRKVNGEIVAVILNKNELTKERRSFDPEMPYFVRWFEKTSDGIITYGEDKRGNEGPKWNVKLSSQGVFERQGVGMSQRGTCTAQQKMF